MSTGKFFCITGVHDWKEQRVQIASDVFRDERHCIRCGKKQIHIRMYPKVRHLAVYKLNRYATYHQGDAVDTLTRHSILPLSERAFVKH